jgi:hypothetical protein
MVVEAYHCLFYECRTLWLLFFLLLVLQLLQLFTIISKGVSLDPGLQRDKFFTHMVVLDKDLPTAEVRVLGFLVLFLEPLKVLS